MWTSRNVAALLLSSLMLSGLRVPSATAQLPDSPTGRRGNALIALLRGGGEVSPEFVRENLADSLFAERTPDEWAAWLRDTLAQLGTVNLEGASKTGPFNVTLLGSAGATGEEVKIHYDVDEVAPHRITRLEFERSAAIAPLSATEMATEADRRLAELAEAGEFSGVALVARGEEILFQKAYGLASRRYGVANELGTAFNLGSINKIFTKIALAQLAAAGELSFDDTVADHLPDYPNRDVAERITIQQVVSHSAGLGDIFTDEFSASSKRAFRSPEDYFRLFADDPLLFEPGQGERYSNGGYIVLGAIIAAVSGMDYHAYVESKILAPAGMTHTRPWALDDPEAPIATGYTRMGAGHEPVALHENTLRIPHTGTPAGGGYSTVADLLAFRQALVGTKLLDRRYTEWLVSNRLPRTAEPQTADAGPVTLGLAIAGGGPGVSAQLEMDGDWTIAVLSNLDPPAAGEAASMLRRLTGAVDRAGD